MALFTRGFQFGGRSGSGLVQSSLVTSSQQETIVLVSTSNKTSDTTIYTVAPGKNLWIVSAWITACWRDSSVGTGGTNTAGIRIAAAFLVGAIVANSTTNTTLVSTQSTNSNSTPFPMPIQVLAGETVDLEVGQSEMTASGGFNGWLEDA